MELERVTVTVGTVPSTFGGVGKGVPSVTVSVGTVQSTFGRDRRGVPGITVVVRTVPSTFDGVGKGHSNSWDRSKYL